MKEQGSDPIVDDSKIKQLGLIAILAVFGVLGGWAAFAPMTTAADATGQVVVERYRKTIQHLEGGIVVSIMVKDGDWVAEGDALILLDDTQFRSELEVLRGQYFISVAREARLVSQRDNSKAISFPSEILSARDDTRALEAMRVQTQTFLARQMAHDNEVSLYEEQINQLRAKMKGLKSQIESSSLLVRSYKSELHDFEKLLKEGYTEKQTVRDLERKYSDSQGKTGELESAIAATALEISETQLKILQLRKELQREVIKEISEVQSELFELREKIYALQQKVERSVIKAPEAGKILGLNVHTLSGVIAPGSPIMEIVPQDEKLIVEARVSPLDIDRVKIGQEAEIRFPAFKSKGLPRIVGHVIALSADSISDPNQQTEPYYLSRVSVDKEGLDNLDKLKLDLVPGMPAEALIKTGERTFLRYLMGPITDVFHRSFIED